MTDLVWDDSGARYFETGVSRGIYFNMHRVGVAWNGLVSVSIDPLGGELESYYFDGVKYMDRILAEDFQATITAINTPKEFEASEGIKNESLGMRTYFHRRAKFNMSWRTIIGNDEYPEVGYRIHIAYNCTLQPSSRSYQTISDNTNMDTRTFTITTTPACGQHSYFTFSSLDGDLSALEARLNAGDLPGCWELKGLVGLPDPDEGCESLVEDFESFVHGQTLFNDIQNDDDGHPQITVHGIINNGLDITTLPANGTYEVNDSLATEVGSGEILADDDDATYVTSASGDLGYTFALPTLGGYVVGCVFELHIRMSITGDVSPDDPDNLDAEAQVFITTDADGDLAVGGFSDGANEGMGFSLKSVDGTIEDYVVPLSMDAWVDTHLEDVVAALNAGAYLNVVAADNNNPDTTPEVRVYEASVEMLNDTQPDKFLRTYDPTDNTEYAGVFLHIYDTYPDLQEFANTTSFDFLVQNVKFNADFEDVVVILAEYVDGPGDITIEVDSGGDVTFLWKEGDGTVLATWSPVSDIWYHVVVDWNFDTKRIRVSKTIDEVVFVDEEASSSINPNTYCGWRGGLIGSDSVTLEVSIDNADIQVHCHEVDPTPEPEWTCFDLSTAVFFSSGHDGKMEGQYVAPVIKSKLVGTFDTRNAQFHFPSFVLNPTKTYEFRAVYAAHTNGIGIYQQNPAWVFWSDNRVLASTFASTDSDHTIFVTVGPGIRSWNAAISDGYQTLIRFDMSTNGDTGAVDGANLLSLCYREV